MLVYKTLQKDGLLFDFIFVLYPHQQQVDKLGFIETRYFKLKEELLLRGYNITIKDDIVHYRKLIPGMYNDYVPTDDAIKLSRARIREKLVQRPNFYTKCGNKVKDL